MSPQSLLHRHQRGWKVPFSGHRASRAVVRPSAQAAQVVQKAPTAPAITSSLTQSELRERVALFNTMSKCKEPFRPRLPQGPVTMYVCGVTVYDYSHIGHARVYVAFDVLYRFLTSACGFDVQYVRNFTDIDDKIIARSQQSGVSPSELTERFIAEFAADMASLNVLPPSLEPRATSFVPSMISTIQAIMDHGHAYAVEGGDVFFDVASLEGYGRLSGRAQEDNRAGERVAVDPRKRSPGDFALWKAAKPGEPSWPSPWGPGRPGWHIECSSMIAELMGPAIDIHGGGRDLVFPHHENELAQSQAACGCGRTHGPLVSVPDAAAPAPSPTPSSSTSSSSLSAQEQPVAAVSPPPAAAAAAAQLHNGRDFVRYWLHNGFVNVDSEKMSKSLGNFFTIRDVLGRYHPLALRWFLVSSHYRAPLNYSDKGLEEASGRLYYVAQARADVAAALRAAGPEAERAVAEARALMSSSHSSNSTQQPPASTSTCNASNTSLKGGPASTSASSSSSAAASLPGPALLSEVLAALADDLNSPAALGALSRPLHTINELLTTKAGRKRPDRLAVLAHLHVAMGRVMELLGMEGGTATHGSKDTDGSQTHGSHQGSSAGSQPLQDGEATAAGSGRNDAAGELVAVGTRLEQLLKELRSLALVRLGMSEEQVQAAIRERAEARQGKDFARSDAIRLELAGRGVLLLDTPQGTTWRPGSAAGDP